MTVAVAGSGTTAPSGSRQIVQDSESISTCVLFIAEIGKARNGKKLPVDDVRRRLDVLSHQFGLKRKEVNRLCWVYSRNNGPCVVNAFLTLRLDNRKSCLTEYLAHLGKKFNS